MSVRGRGARLAGRGFAVCLGAAVSWVACAEPTAPVVAADARVGADDARTVGAADAALGPADATTAPTDAAPTDAAPAPDAAPARDDVGPGGEDAAAAPRRCSTRAVAAAPLMPVPGELFLAHIGLGGFTLGESTLAILPGGERVLIDVGNNAHADDVLAAIDALVGRRELELIVLTHHHADHEDALPDLLDALQVGAVVHRGLTDLTPAANEATMSALCAARGRAPQVELCTHGDLRCDPGAWSLPATSCPGLPYRAGALLLLAANATAHGRSLRPLLADDNNGENARSVVGVLAHGDFRYVFAGDLTGGGSDTDEAERFLVGELGAELPPADVLHLSHHARDTSSSGVWLDHLLPADGRPRTAVAGISTAHVGSPHASVVRAVVPRLGGGGLFASRVAAGGASGDVIDARGGTVRVLTADGGASYRVQAVDGAGNVIETRQTTSAAGCDP